jgi:hypothetical protein
MRYVLVRLVTLLSLFSLLMALGAPKAAAGTKWCRNDPIIDIGGKQAHVWIASVEGAEAAISGPTTVRIAVPMGVSTNLVWTDDGFGHGYAVEFVESDDLRLTNGTIEIEASVYVPGAAMRPILVEVTNQLDEVLESGVGGTNDWIVARTQL